MADITIIGYLQGTRVVNDGANIMCIIDEYKPPYKNTNTNEQVQARMVRWHIVFKQYFIKFIRNNFVNGMLVKIRGSVEPNAKNVLRIVGETINMTKTPVNLTKLDKSVKQSERGTERAPFDGLEEYLTQDF